MYRPTELLEFLKQLGVRPHKGLSQNFLIDGNIVRKTVQVAAIKKGDRVVEIGPGPGALTQELLTQGAFVLAIEKDPIFAKALLRLQTKDPRLEVTTEDALEFDFRNKLFPNTKIVSNLPYHVATPILTRLAPLNHLISSLTVMVQKEFADRLAAAPKSEDYSSLTVFMNFYTQFKSSFIVEPPCFYPRPKVRSTVIHFLLKKPPHVSSEERFFQMTRAAFQQRRKMVRTSLKQIYDGSVIEKGLVQAGLAPLCRPEELSLDDFLRLFQEIEKQSPNIQD